MDDISQASSFESSEVLAAFLASTTIPSDSWLLCSLANATAPRGFVVKQAGATGYVAFSGIQEMPAGVLGSGGPGSADLVPLDATSNARFPPFKVEGGGAAALRGDGEEEIPAMVHAGMLQLFISFLTTTDLESQILQLAQQSKSIIIAGHSIGATTASLTALWLLSRLKLDFSSLPVLCVTFGSPLLGNEALSNVINRERWGGRFCHIVSNYDIMPRLLFAPLHSLAHQLHCLLQFWHLSMASQMSHSPVLALTEDDINSFCGSIFSGVEVAARAEEGSGTGMESVWPFGSYLFCSTEGAICVDNANCVIKMLHLMLLSGSPGRCIEDHLLYGAYSGKLCHQFLTRRNFMEKELPESSYEASVSLALRSSGTLGQEVQSKMATDCLVMARREGRLPLNISSANLAIRMSKFNPFRAEIEWYKATCDRMGNQLGYYDSFKRRGLSKRENRVNLNRIKLGGFWDDVIHMWERSELPHDFHLRAKWVNGAQFYKLLVEPLEIAEYYRLGIHRMKGHYLTHGRERRFQVFDRWWTLKGAPKEEPQKRSRFASLTQDSCFWARVEEAWDWLEDVGNESSSSRAEILLEKIRSFETRANELIENKEVSEDVIASNSTYSLWITRWRELQQSTFPPERRDNGHSA